MPRFRAIWKFGAKAQLGEPPLTRPCHKVSTPRKITLLLVSATSSLCVPWLPLSQNPAPIGKSTPVSLRPPKPPLHHSEIARSHDRPLLPRTPSSAPVEQGHQDPSRLELNTKDRVAEEIEYHGGSWDLLGKIEVFSSDLIELCDGTAERHTVIRSSRNQELVLVIERFDRQGVFIHSTFHSAEKIVVRLEEGKSVNSFRRALVSMGLSAEPPPGWHDLIEVRVEPNPQRIFESKKQLENLAGPRGSVFLAGVMPE